MSERMYSESHRNREEDDEVTQEQPVAAKAEAPDTDIDTVLDEIDGVLEENAEAFVRDFVQKGGQ